MKLSKNFLSDYLDTKKINFFELADKMVLLGHEYEEVKKLCDVKDLVVGEVLTCKKHPESNKLSICKVNIGDSTHQIVCGASNVDASQKVIVAKVGSVLPENFTIKKARLAGVESEGMICSYAELGIEKTFLTETDYETIKVLPNDAKVGEDAIKYLKLDDEVINFELTTNRGDLLSVIGMAYEIGALYNLETKYPEVTYKETEKDIKQNYSLKVETDNCFLYLAKLVNNIRIEESPLYIKNRLIASGIRPINNVVDISNYVMLETGQPIHFFDADKIKKLGVRMGVNEEIQTLDGQIRIASSEDILITNDDKPIALAGVMGGLSSEVTKNTRNIIIESAIFNPISIRKTSKKMLRSEASIRFEKGLPKERTYLAVKRACHLLEKYAFGQVASGMLIDDRLEEKEKIIDVSVSRLNQLLGINLKKEVILDVLNRLQLPYQDGKTIKVLIPSRRLDLNIFEDLVEEVGRMIGYDKIVGKLPTGQIKLGTREPKIEYFYKIREFLVGVGLTETINYSLMSEGDIFTEDKLKILSSLSKEREYLRTCLVSSLLNVYHYNYARKITDINIFEIGAIYQKDYSEINHLAILMSGNYLTNRHLKKEIKADFYLLKGIIEQLLNYLGFEKRYQINQAIVDRFHPGRCAEVLIDDKAVGFFGQIHPSIANQVYLCQLDLELLFKINIKSIKYKEAIKFPVVYKDVAFVVDQSLPASEIENIIKKIGGRMLLKVEVFDVYQIDEKKKSVAYSLVFQDKTRTLNDEEVMLVFNKIIKEVETKLKAELRK